MVLRDLKVQFVRIKRIISMASKATEEQLPEYLELLELEFINFLSKGEADKRYSACAQAYIEQGKSKIIEELTVLRNLQTAMIIPA